MVEKLFRKLYLGLIVVCLFTTVESFASIIWTPRNGFIIIYFHRDHWNTEMMNLCTGLSNSWKQHFPCKVRREKFRRWCQL